MIEIDLKIENEKLKKEIKELKLKLRSKEQIVKSIIKKLRVEKPYKNLANSLHRLNLEDLSLLESKIK